MDGATLSATASALVTVVSGLVAIAAGVVTISKAWGLIQKHLHPEADLRPAVDRHGVLLDKDKRRLDEHEELMSEMRKGINVLCQTQLALIDHALSGNDVEHLRRARDGLDKYLVER